MDPYQQDMGLDLSNPGTKVFIGNVAWSTTNETLSDYLAQQGTPAVTVELKISASGQSKGWAIAEFASPDAADAVIQSCNGVEIDGRAINVRLDRGPGPSRRDREAAAPREYDDSEPAGGTHLYIGNLSWSITTEDLSQILDTQGVPAVSVEVMMQRTNGRSKGFAIADYATEESAGGAIAVLNNMEVDGRSMHVRFDRKKGSSEGQQRQQREPRERAPRNNNRSGGDGAPRGLPAGATEGAGFRVFVSNLSWDTSWQGLKDHFASAGDVAFADVMTDKRTGRSKGFGIVAMSSAEGAESAIAMLNETEVDGRNIAVREYKD